MSFTVGQLAKLTGLTVRALHHYDAIGLLTPSQRSDAGYRLYTQQDVAKLFRIQALQNIGLSLDEVGQALARDGATVPHLIAQQLAALNEQIEHASALRERLVHLQAILRRGDEPAASEWVAAVELITQYGKYCSPEELQRLIAHNNDDLDAWQKLIADLRDALVNRLAPTTAEAHLLLRQWSTLLLRKVGGDIQLAIKMKLAYVDDPAMQARMEMRGGVSPEMMEYLGQVMIHAHRGLWGKHLTPSELQRLQFLGKWQHDLLPTIAAFLRAASEDAPTEDRNAAYLQWQRLLSEFAGGDGELCAKVSDVLCGVDADPELAQMWLLSAELRGLLRSLAASHGLHGTHNSGSARLQ